MAASVLQEAQDSNPEVSAANFSVALPSAVTAGSAIHVIAHALGSSAPGSWTCSDGTNTYTNLGGVTDTESGSPESWAHFVAANVSAHPSSTFTVTFDTTITYQAIWVREIGGVGEFLGHGEGLVPPQVSTSVNTAPAFLSALGSSNVFDGDTATAASPLTQDVSGWTYEGNFSGIATSAHEALTSTGAQSAVFDSSGNTFGFGVFQAIFAVAGAASFAGTGGGSLDDATGSGTGTSPSEGIVGTGTGTLSEAAGTGAGTSLPPASGNASVLQEAQDSDLQTSVGSYSIALPNHVTAGSAIHVVIHATNSTNPASWTFSDGTNSYTNLGSFTDTTSGSEESYAHAVATNVTGGATTVTVTFDTTIYYQAIWVREIGGVGELLGHAEILGTASPATATASISSEPAFMSVLGLGNFIDGATPAPSAPLVQDSTGWDFNGGYPSGLAVSAHEPITTTGTQSATVTAPSAVFGLGVFQAIFSAGALGPVTGTGSGTLMDATGTGTGTTPVVQYVGSGAGALTDATGAGSGNFFEGAGVGSLTEATGDGAGMVVGLSHPAGDSRRRRRRLRRVRPKAPIEPTEAPQAPKPAKKTPAKEDTAAVPKEAPAAPWKPPELAPLLKLPLPGRPPEIPRTGLGTGDDMQDLLHVLLHIDRARRAHILRFLNVIRQFL